MLKKFIIYLCAVCQAVNGVVCLQTSAMTGDVDGNGIVDATDASSVLVEYASLSTTEQITFTENQTACADINGDGFIDAVDASYILSYYAYTSTGGTISFDEWFSGNNVHDFDGLTYIDGILIANKSYSLPSTYNPGMSPEALQQFEVLQTAAQNDGINIYFLDGYRTYDYQNEVYNNFVNWYGVEMADISAARAGHSEHQTGLAIDVSTDANIFEGTPAAVWIANHAHEYGFIVRYPKGKENITGYKYEPWHIRYLGVEKATDVYNSGLTLEEYLGIDSYYH